MEACPNIGGREIRRRIVFGYIGLSLTLVLILYVVLFNGPTTLNDPNPTGELLQIFEI